jgi:hypothetical protein
MFGPAASRLARRTAPALVELCADPFAAPAALPVRASGHRGAAYSVDEAAGLQRVAVAHDPQFRPALDERDLAQDARKPLVAYEAGDARALEDIAQVGDLEDRLRRVDLAQVSLPTPALSGSLHVSPVAPSR